MHSSQLHTPTNRGKIKRWQHQSQKKQYQKPKIYKFLRHLKQILSIEQTIEMISQLDGNETLVEQL